MRRHLHTRTPSDLWWPSSSVGFRRLFISQTKAAADCYQSIKCPPLPRPAERSEKIQLLFFLRIFNVSHSLEQPDKPVAQLSIQRTAGPERWTQPIFTRPPAQWEPRPTDIPPINRPTVVTCKYSPQSPLLRRVAAIFTPFRLGPFETAPYPPTPLPPTPFPEMSSSAPITAPSAH